MFLWTMIVEQTACCPTSTPLPIAVSDGVTAESDAEGTERKISNTDQVVDVDRFASFWYSG